MPNIVNTSSLITEVQIVPIKPQKGLIAFCSVVLAGKVYLGSIGVHRKLDGSGLRLTYPTRKIGNRDLNIFHPINRAFAQEIEKAVFDEILKIMPHFL
jgi:stage V sporulation protein G